MAASVSTGGSVAATATTVGQISAVSAFEAVKALVDLPLQACQELEPAEASVEMTRLTAVQKTSEENSVRSKSMKGSTRTAAFRMP